MYPIEKYKFYHAGNKIIAASTYAGKTVRGVAKCAPSDNFDLTKGKELAAARCAQKVAGRRVKRAYQKYLEAREAYEKAISRVSNMKFYYFDAVDAKDEADYHLKELIKSMEE